MSYSFAKTPLKAAHAPLAAASGIQGILAVGLGLTVGLGESVDGGIASGIKGSASACMISIYFQNLTVCFHSSRNGCRETSELIASRLWAVGEIQIW